MRTIQFVWLVHTEKKTLLLASMWQQCFVYFIVFYCKGRQRRICKQVHAKVTEKTLQFGCNTIYAQCERPLQSTLLRIDHLES